MMEINNSRKNKKKICIIGAGPAGLSAAYILTKNNFKVDVYETSNHAGGMARTIELWDQMVDMGPHRFFSSDPRVNNLWLEIVKKDYEMVKRTTRIFYKNKFFHYPIRPLNALMNLGFLESVHCAISYFLAKLKRKNYKSNTFEAWVIDRFGRRLFEIFFKSYSEKLWGLKCSELDSDFAAQRIKKLSLFEAIKTAILGNNFKHKTLVDEFAYPKYGTGMVYERMAAYVSENGNKILYNKKVLSIKNKNKKFSISVDNNNEIIYDTVISTMPITSLINHLNAPENVKNSAKNLKFRNTILVFIKLDNCDPFPDQWIYIHSQELLTGRITNFKNWVPNINKGKSDTILCLEYWCNNEDKIWNESNEYLISLAKKELLHTKLINLHQFISGEVVKIPKCYPIYKSNYKEHLKPIQNYLSKIYNLLVIGRYGSFKYNNQDHSILMGLLAADNLINNNNHNLWELNSDYEYQESSRITSTGLQK